MLTSWQKGLRSLSAALVPRLPTLYLSCIIRNTLIEIPVSFPDAVVSGAALCGVAEVLRPSSSRFVTFRGMTGGGTKMIMYVSGNLFQSPAQVLVNTVNTVGVMGKGVALQFKKLFPEMFVKYRDLCERKEFQIGQLWLYESPNKWVLNFPTKEHWRNPSRVEYITAGLENFARNYGRMRIHSIAFPPLGCGNGRLDFESQVQPEMEKHLRPLPIEVFIYPQQDDQFVAEHESPQEMREWLHSEPRSLPFSEVWEDLVQLLGEQNSFETLVKGSPFSVQVISDPPGLEIKAAEDKRLIPCETLMAFWQQLRTHGFSMRHIIPGNDRLMSYLIPVFARLHYVRPVKVSDRYDRLGRSPVIGLQVLPSAFSRSQVQLPLFEPA